MFAFAPPVKVPRTQRQSIIHAAEEPLTSSRSHQWGEAAPQVHPSYMEDAVLRVGTCGGTMAEPSRYLSGVGTHMCWHIDENQRLVRLWNLSSASWKRTEPRMAELPYFAAAEEGLPLFVCEMDDAEESLAFCSERGAISSLDHSVEFKLLDDGPHEEYLAASSFACVRRIAADGESMVYTAVGTTAGNIIVDVKRRGEHLTSLVEGRSLLTSSEGSANRVGPSRWWSSMKSFVGASPSGSHHSQDGERGISPVSKLCFRRGSTATPLLWAATAAAEIACVDFDALQRGEGPRSLRPLWTMNLNNALALHEGVILSMSISTKRIFVLLWSQPPPESRSLPSLILATLNAESGAVVNYLTIHTVADVVHAAREVPQQHIRVVGNDEQSEVFIFIKQFCVRVNNEIGARHPCASEDTIVLRRLVQPMGTVMMGDGSIIALDVEGPVVAVENIFADVSEQTEEAHTPTLTFTGRAAALTWGDDADTQRCLTDLLRGVRTDQKLTLDEAVLQTSEEIVASCKPNEGNWARANLDSEDENIVLHVTRQLKRRQQSHRRFLIAVLQHEDMMAELAPTTIAQLVSTQEALLVLSALRSMQNVGMTVSSLSLDTYQQVPLMAGMMHEDVARGSHAVPLMVSAEHLSRCQQMLRLCVVSVAQEQRRASASSPEVLASTAAELCFSHPSMAVQLLRAIGEHLMQVRSTVAVGAVDKFISSHAAAAIFVVSAQTIIESREDLKQIYAMPTSTERFLWTASSDSVMGVELSFTHLEGHLADALSDLFLATAVRNSSPSTPSPRTATLLIPQSEQLAFLDLITYLLFFSCVMHGRSGDHAFYSNLLTRTLLRAPLVASPFGYPHGAPQPVSAIGELSQRALRVAERFALTFDAVEVLLGMSLASPVSDPYEHPEMYAKLELYCLQNPRMLRFAMDGLWRSGREWELLALPAALTRIDGAAAERDRFLSEFAPHLLWLANPSRFDALLAEGSTCPPVVAFGPTQLSHRSRCAALARLAWIADGASTSTTAYAELELETRMSTAQTTFLASTSSGIALGPQEIVQRLLQLEDSPAAWLAAAQVAELIRSNVSDDLLGQVIKRCKAHDGPERLMKIHRDSVSELETSAALRATAVGQLLSQCSAFKNPQTLHRVGAVALTNDELRLLSSWLATLWTGESVREA